MTWEQLLNIVQEASQESRNTDVVACPNDGEPLKVGPDGSLYCTFDGWVKR